MPKIDFRTYLAIEIGLSRRLVSHWKRICQPVYTAIAEAVINHDWHKATMLVHDLDMTAVGEENKEYIRYMLSSAAVYGGRMVNKKGTKVLDHPNADKVLDQTVSNMLQYLTNQATTTVQTKALQLIAKAENEWKHQQIMGKSFKAEFNEAAHPREPAGSPNGGEFTSGNTQQRWVIDVPKQTVQVPRTYSQSPTTVSEGPRSDRFGDATTLPSYGTGVQGSVSVVGTHYSQSPRQFLSGDYYGHGLKGAEASRLSDTSADPRIRKRIYFYVDEGKGIVPEAGVGGSAHQVKLNNLYDPEADKAEVWRRGKGDTNASEKAVIDAGYDGYYVRNFANNAGVAVLLGDHTVPVQSVARKGDVDGHEFHGNQWTSGTGSENFKKWFGKSVLVNKDGSPMVFYRATDSDREEFRKSWRGGLIYFSSTPEGALRASRAGDNVVYPVYLRAEKVRGWGGPGVYYGDAEAKGYEDKLTKGGFDSVKVRDESSHNGAITIAVLNPNQIKSAIGNDGSYSPTDARITKDDMGLTDLSTAGRLEAQLGFRRKRKKGDKEPLYVSRKLANPEPFIAWAKEQGFTKVLAPEELHVTIVYSNDAMDWDAVEPNEKPMTVKGGKRTVTPLGDQGAVVLNFESSVLQKRWKEFRDAGASWDYESYQPHISITYKNGIEDLSKVSPYDGPIELGAEIYEPIDEDYAEEVVEKADASGRYVTPLVDFTDAGSSLAQMVSSLNTSRLSTWGFTAEADTVGAQRYQLTAVMDNRTSPFCRFIDGKEFDVQTAKDLVNDALSVQDPQDLATVQPWPDQSKAAIAEYESYSEQDLVDAGLNIPPFHPNCRTMCTMVDDSGDGSDQSSSDGSSSDDSGGSGLLGTIGELAPSLGLAMSGSATAEDFSGLSSVPLTEEQLSQWNDYIDAMPDEVLNALYDTAESEGVSVSNSGDLFLWAKGKLDTGEWDAETAIDPFSGKIYLSQADFVDAEPEVAAEYLSGMLDGAMNVSSEINADQLIVDVGDNAAAFTEMGFLPQADDWQAIRMDALDSIASGDLQPFFDSLDEETQAAVTDLLNSDDEHAIQALMDIPTDYGGQSLGEAILSGFNAQFYLDLTDEEAVARAQEYLQT